MTELENIASKVLAGGRIDAEEARLLWEDAPLWQLAQLAVAAKRRHSGDKVFYNRNFHVEPTNICRFDCLFCSYRRTKGETGAWELSTDEILAEVRRQVAENGATEVHIVGGAHPDRDLEYYEGLLSAIRNAAPDICIKAFTAVELDHMFSLSGVGLEHGIARLKTAGMESMAGGGAEIFDADVRRKICPSKCDAERWLQIHAAAHLMGIDSNATMLYGHIEKIPHRIDHLMRLRAQQDATGGFNAFIPLKYRAANNPLSELGETSVVDDMRTLAMSRIVLDNVPHVKAYWVMYGKQTAELALAFGADDLDGTIGDSTRIYSMAGAEDNSPVMSVEEIRSICGDAGWRAVERDTHYNEIG